MPPKYYLPYATRNPLVRLKYHIIDKRRPLPEVPKHIQIQTISGCNANCIFCPNKKTEREIPVGRKMEWELFRSIVDQAIELGIERFSPYLMNEPLLDSELPERIAYITKNKKAFQFTKINSHGNLLTERMAKGILDSGLDRVNFSVQGLDAEEYQRTMNLPLQRTLDNIDRLLDLKRAGNYKTTRIRVCMLVTKIIEPQLPQIKEYWAARRVKVNFNRIESRGNHDKIQTEEIALRALKQFDWCNRMFEQMYVLCDGRLVQCCADWEQRGVMGDASKDPLAQIWKSFRYRLFREHFLNGDIRGMICNGCTKDAAKGDVDEE